MPGAGDYLQMYERLVTEQGAREIVSVHMTSIGSGAYQAARAAQAMALEHLPKVRIEVIDTRNAAMAHGWSVIEAARAALAGLRLDEVVERVRTLIPLCRMILTADTLRYLYMGGRIGHAAQLVGTALNIKPLIGMEDGVIVALGQARSRSQAYQKIVEMVESFVGPQGRVRNRLYARRRPGRSRETAHPGRGARDLRRIPDRRALPRPGGPLWARNRRSVFLSRPGLSADRRRTHPPLDIQPELLFLWLHQ